MKRVKGFVFNSFVLDNRPDASGLGHLRDIFESRPYREETGFGFSKITMDTECISAVLLKKGNTYIQSYDEKTGELVKSAISVFTTLRFEIDVAREILTAYGGYSQLNSLRSVFRNIPELKFGSEPIEIRPADFRENLDVSSVGYQIKQLTVKSFNYQDAILGRFSGEVSDQLIGSKVLEDYGSNVVKVTFQLRTDGGDLLVQLHPQGNIKMLCEEDEFEYYLNYLKQLIF